ncbi:uncharacterized protein LOC130212122 [Pseudoliparis swirei]|uniref:uncharacterized protein LOC130212122 n=1 Tax=Pseudoliparis swirei TaxID=2059687 RepID=UPI0024BE3E89|nr:uncharacterized protein LOC130212122 [Pseudoliparis swirei]
MSCRMLLLLFISLLFILPSCVCGPFVVNVTQSSYQAEENHSVTLEWTFTTNTERPSDSPDVLCELLADIRPFNMLYVQDGVQNPKYQDEHFAGRVQWDQDLLRGGRVRLHVSRLRTSDSGRYLCGVLTSYGRNSETCRLNVSAVRDRPEPETNGPDGGRDSSGTESRPQPESLGWIGLYWEDVDSFLKQPGNETADSALRKLDEQYQKYKYMELNLSQKKLR